MTLVPHVPADSQQAYEKGAAVGFARVVADAACENEQFH